MKRRRHGQTMKEAQRECRRLRARGDPASRRKAASIERRWVRDPDYESDMAFIGRMESGRQFRADFYSIRGAKLRRRVLR